MEPIPLSSSPKVSEVDLQHEFPPIDVSHPLFDWGDFLDFALTDDPPPTAHDDNHNHLLSPSLLRSDTDAAEDTISGAGGRVRKRDPKLTCENFLAGIVPCACPEMDALLAEEDELRGTGKKKKARTVKGVGVLLRCQVIGCEVDITELKGYHKRHRVCLECANASEIPIDGETKRYCQQCGKFHVLSDFDEGKRSCRRKLKIHNNRRRRKQSNFKGSTVEETQGGSLVAPHESLVTSEDAHVANISSTLGSQDARSDSPGSDETNMEGTKDSSKHDPLSSNGDNKSAFSSACPTGRISFKLYDWNPAEFPRRLRHQIFQWLASMPVELEGYIRPGCTILTVFFSMPEFMWIELFKDPASQLQDFVSTPGRLLSGKGSMHVYLNNFRFMIAKNGTFVKNVLTHVKAPKLHYVHPTFFEAGKPMEFVACGSHLFQPKFKFLVSFQEKYITSEGYLSFSAGQSEMKCCSFSHQKYKIYAPLTDSNVFGSAFIEVENESGLSNFIPVLVADKDVCVEMERIQQKCAPTFCSKSFGSEAHKCEIYMQRHATLSDFLLDIAWLLKKPDTESVQEIMTSSQITTYVSILNYLIHHDSCTILDRVLKSLNTRITRAENCNPGYTTCEDGIRLLHKKVDQANNVLKQRQSSIALLTHNSFPSELLNISCQYPNISPYHAEDTRSTVEHKYTSHANSASTNGCETVPFLSVENVVNVNHRDKWSRQSCSATISSTRSTLRTTLATVSLAAVAIVCFGVCAVIFLPHKIGPLPLLNFISLTDHNGRTLITGFERIHSGLYRMLSLEVFA